MVFEKELLVAKRAALEAGERVLSFYNSGADLGLGVKSDSSPVTNADLAANKIIISIIKESFPNDRLLTEESCDDSESENHAGRLWIIDPLDGTKEFIKGSDEFTINIALVINKRPVLGVIYAPAKNELYYGSDSLKGSFLEQEGLVKELKISLVDDFDKGTITISASHNSPEELLIAELFRKTIFKGSSLKGMALLTGVADLYLRTGPVNEWDVAAMNAIINNAGGAMVSLVDEKPVTYDNKDPLIKGFIAGNERLILKTLSQLRKLKEKKKK